MRVISRLTLAPAAFAFAVVLAFVVVPDSAQSPGSQTMPAGVQNPALVQQPQLVTPLRLPRQPGAAAAAPQPQLAQPYQPGPQPGGTAAAPQPQLAQPYQPGPQPGAAQPGPTQPGPTPNEPAPSALISPDGTGGLCECLISHDPSLSVFDKSRMHQSCLASVDACQAACNTQRYFSFVPHAIFTCPGRSIERNSVAANTNTAGRRLLAQR
jgi:hypothetical protein